jgi:hypothetical protein
MKTFTSTKTVNPHQNMPSNVKNAFFEVMRKWDFSNNSFYFWTINNNFEYDLNDPHDMNQKIVSDWVDQNFPNEKEVIVLYWW